MESEVGVFVARIYHEEDTDESMCQAINNWIHNWREEEPYIRILSTQILERKFNTLIRETVTRLYVNYIDTREE